LAQYAPDAQAVQVPTPVYPALQVQFEEELE
jgi:hypothetical protein